MQYQPKEIELQTYSISYAYPATLPSALPYSWNEECHLVVNNRFYSSAHHEQDNEAEMEREEELIEQPELPAPLEFEVNSPCAKMEDVLSEDQYSYYSSSNNLSVSASSVSASDIRSTHSSQATNTTARGAKHESSMKKTLDEQLDFIMESGKKPPKPKVDKKRQKRSRKTKTQLAVLEKELKDVINADKEKIKSVALLTGLKEVQVYKWYWDRRAKLT